MFIRILFLKFLIKYLLIHSIVYWMRKIFLVIGFCCIFTFIFICFIICRTVVLIEKNIHSCKTISKNNIHEPTHNLDENRVMKVRNYVENAIQLQLVRFDLRIDDDRVYRMTSKKIKIKKIFQINNSLV